MSQTTDGRPALSIVIPAFNESARLPSTLRDIRAFLNAEGRSAEVIVVDDGSVDATGAVVAEQANLDTRIRLIRLPQNRGKGYAVRTGVVNATGERVLFCDADGATPIGELRRLEAKLDAGFAMAIGSRELRGADTRVEARLPRRVLGRVFHGWVRLFTVRAFADTQCGFKLFSARCAHDLFARMQMCGFSFDVELLFTARRLGYEVAEVPVNWTHVPGSKVSVLSDGLRMALDVTRIRANAVRGVYDAPHIAPHVGASP